MTETGREQTASSHIAAARIRAQIERIAASAEFKNSPRLQTMLNYIVEETPGGRAKYIKGATIGAALFSSGGDFDPDSNSVVRVEMGRLRRRLAEYYRGSGKTDPLLVTIPKGSYVPSFSPKPESAAGEAAPARSASRWTSWRGWVVMLVVLLTVPLAIHWLQDRERTAPESERDQWRAGLFSTNAEAESMFRQAYELLMPPSDQARLVASQHLFRRVTELDTGFAGGYAGGSIALSFQVFFFESADPALQLNESVSLAERAVALAPDFALGNAALALASAVARQPERAHGAVSKVIAIRPRNPDANAIAALALIVSGMPSKAVDLLTEALRLNPDEPRTPYLNLLGTANYLTGDYSGAAQSFEENLDRGGPAGPHIGIFLAASYAQLGKDFEARAVIEDLKWKTPDYPFEEWLANFITAQDDLISVMQKLRALGLPQNG